MWVIKDGAKTFIKRELLAQFVAKGWKVWHPEKEEAPKKRGRKLKNEK